MKRITFIATLILIVVLNNLYSQNAIKKTNSEYPVEDLIVHLSQKSFFAGEPIWFNVYCTSPLYPDVELSQMAYIELTDSENAALLREKIMLIKGVGKGEFIIPKNSPTGIYYIKAYTKWMKNFGKESKFTTTVTIINPDEEFETQINKEENVKLIDLDKLKERTVVSPIKITPEKQIYTTREKVKVKIEPNKLSDLYSGGTYSIAVSRKEPILHSEVNSTIPEMANDKPMALTFLPDYKGIVLTGNISMSTGEALSGEPVILSYPGSGTDVNSTITDKNGNFNFLLQAGEGEKDIVFTLPSPNLKLRLEEPFWNYYQEKLTTDKALTLDKNALSFLKERYFHFQLQQKFKQQYFEKRIQPDLTDHTERLFYGTPTQVIELDKYIKLDSITEYFWELIPSVKFLKKRDGFDIQIINPATTFPFEEAPGVFVDGVLYNDFNEIAGIPVENLRQIAVIPFLYYYRDFSFGGIVDIHTKENNFNVVKLLPQMQRVLYPLGTASETIFKAPDYSNNKLQNRIPDLRYLLCWNPDVIVNANEDNYIEFYTSDIEGEYEIKLVGISNDGSIQQSENKIIVKAR